MNTTVKDRVFLEAVAVDTLPRYNSLGGLRRAANRLIRGGLLESRQIGAWTHYSLTPAGQLETIRASLRAGNISYGELAELQSLASYIEPGDTELLEAASVPEFPGTEGNPDPLEVKRIVSTRTYEHGTVESIGWSPVKGAWDATVQYDGDARLTSVPLSELEPEEGS